MVSRQSRRKSGPTHPHLTPQEARVKAFTSNKNAKVNGDDPRTRAKPLSSEMDGLNGLLGEGPLSSVNLGLTLGSPPTV